MGVNITETALDVLTRITNHGSYSNPSSSKVNVHKWYHTMYGVPIEDIGTVVPKWDPRIEGTIDGLADDGIVDIRQPTTMYKALIHHTKKIEKGWTPDKFCRDHLFSDHYVHMQANMRICGKLWCDYIVYVHNQIYVERVLFNESYWNDVIWPQVDNFLTHNLAPALTVAR